MGNPGARYADHRHNAGAWFIERLGHAYGMRFAAERRFNATVATADLGGRRVRIMLTSTFMNESGRAVAPLAHYYRIPPPHLLVVHDELDLPVGSVRLKCGGGHGGHNGLRDITTRLGSGEFARLRVGIGRPAAGRDATGHVLSAPPAAERALIDEAMDRAIGVLGAIVNGEFATAMNRLHSAAPTPGATGDH